MNKNFKYLFWFSLSVKLFVALVVPLALDEYYYSIWGQNPRLSYFDHPPMVGWLMMLGQAFSFIKLEAIRWPFIIMTHATLYIWYLIIKEHFSQVQKQLFMWVALLNPLWGWGVFIATPDIPLIFFWSLGLYFVNQILARPSPTNYFGLGAALGLGFLSKYVIVLFPVCLFVFIAAKKCWHLLFSWKTIVTLLVGLFFCTPVIYWNLNHDWASFNFQWKHGMSSENWQWKWPIEYLIGIILVTFPTLFIFFIVNSRKQTKTLLFIFSIIPLVFFLYSSFKGRVEANWPIVAYPSLFSLALFELNQKRIRWVKLTLIIWGTFLILALLLPLYVHQLNQPEKIRLFEAKKYDVLVDFMRTKNNVFTDNYQSASYASHKLDRLVCKLPLYGRKDFFNYLESCNNFPDSFYYIVETWAGPQIKQDLPLYEIVGEEKINKNYKALEVRKR